MFEALLATLCHPMRTKLLGAYRPIPRNVDRSRLNCCSKLCSQPSVTSYAPNALVRIDSYSPESGPTQAKLMLKALLATLCHPRRTKLFIHLSADLATTAAAQWATRRTAERRLCVRAGSNLIAVVQTDYLPPQQDADDCKEASLRRSQGLTEFKLALSTSLQFPQQSP